MYVCLCVYSQLEAWKICVDSTLIKMENIILNGKRQLRMNLDDQRILMSMNRPMILRVELNTVHLQQHYSLFMHNKLQYS